MNPGHRCSLPDKRHKSPETVAESVETLPDKAVVQNPGICLRTSCLTERGKGATKGGSERETVLVNTKQTETMSHGTDTRVE